MASLPSRILGSGVRLPSPSSLFSTLGTDAISTLFSGIKIDCNWTYKASFYAKLASSFTSDLTVSLSLISNTTGTVFATQDFTGITDEWKQFDTKLTPSSSAEDLNNTFVVQVNGGEGESGEVLFGLFSLFPPTYKDR